ncbi:MAG: hypothetical protein NTY01_02865, partial [Verrucomicrobia bacterium]|nr:hypothetical protein [Verrucomicrobiota bacterium]
AVAAVYDRRSSSAKETAGGHRPPLQHLPGGRVPESLSAVTMKAMALEQAARYQSVPELQREIEAYQNGFATSAEHASLLKQLVLFIKRHKAVFGTAFAAGLLITVLTVWFVINLRASERAARAAEAVAVEEKESTRQALATTALALAEAAFREQDGPAMQAALNEVPDDLRDSNWSYLLEKSDTSLATIRSRSTGTIASAAPHPKQPGVFAIAGSDHWVSLVEVRTGARLLEFQPGFKDKSSTSYRLAFSPDGERLAIGRLGAGAIVIHSVRDGKKLAEWETADTNELQFSPDGRQLMEVTRKQLNLWDAATGRRLWMAPKAPHAVFDPGGKMILVTFQQNLKLLKAQDGSLLRQLPDARDNITSIAIRPDGARALISDGNGFVRCLDLRDGRILYEMRANDQTVLALAYTPEGGRFVTLAMLSGGRRALQLWDANTGTLLQPLLGGGGLAYDFSVHPVSGEIVVSGLETKAWNLTGQQEKWRLSVSAAAQRIAFWKTDDWIFTENRDLSVELLDFQTTDPIKHPIWKPEAPFYRLVSVSADGRFAAVGKPSNGQIHFLRLNGQTVEEVRAFPIKEGKIYQMELSPTGDRLWIWKSVVDPATGAELLRLDRKGSYSVALSRWLNDTQVVEAVTTKAPRGQPGSEEQLIVWDATTGQRLRTVTNRSVIFSLAVAPDGQTVAEAGADKMVRLRDAATLEVKQEFRAHDGPILALAFHPTQPILATASDDLTVKLWNLDTGHLLEELRGPRGAPVDLVFSPSGKRLACLTPSDRSTRIWEPASLNPDASAKVNAGGWEDLLAHLKRDDVAKNGNGWQLNNGALISSSNGYSSIALQGSFAQSNYQVRVKLRQLKPENAFEVILPVADRQVAFKLDGHPKDGFFTSLLMVEGKDSRNVPGALKGKQVQDSDQHELELAVRPEGANASIEARLDGQPLYQWSGLVTALSLYSKWPALPPGTLALGAHRADWVVYAVKVKRLEGKP